MIKFSFLRDRQTHGKAIIDILHDFHIFYNHLKRYTFKKIYSVQK